MTRRPSLLGKRPLAIAVAAFVAATAAHAASYTAVPLTVSGGITGDLVFPQAINNAGVVVGRTDGRNYQSLGAQAAIRTRTGAAQTFTVDGQDVTELTAIATDGTLAGNAGAGPFDMGDAFIRLADGSVQRLFDSETVATAMGVNSAHQVAGYVATSVSDQVGFVWQDGVVTWLPSTLGGTGSAASAINESGTVVGAAATPTPYHSHAFRWKDGVMTDLGTLPGDFDDTSGAAAINARGLVVGHCGVSRMVACAWTTDNRVHSLGVVPGHAASIAYAVNDLGVAVGWGLDSSLMNRAVIFHDRIAEDLNALSTLPAGVVLTRAVAINRDGVILVNGVKGKVGVQYALIPQ